MKPALLACSLALVAVAAPALAGAALAPDNTQAERERIAAERRTADAEFGAAQAACQGKFLLTPCLDAARETHRTALERQRRQLLLVDDAARRERSADRLRLLQRRAAEPAPSTGPAARSTRSPAQAASGAGPATSTTALRASARGPGTTASAAAAQAPQTQQADYQRRQQAIQAHRQAITDRNARQDALHPQAAGLPVPPVPPAASAGLR